MTAEPPASPLLKDILGQEALTAIADAGTLVSHRFDRAAFLDAAATGLDALSIMQRVRHIADALHTALPPAYREAIAIVCDMGEHLKHGFQAMAVTEYVARHGLGDFDLSMNALARLTRYGSAEFAIRPFLAQDHSRTLEVMLGWTDHENEHVRRLASEGSRPRLPWAARVPAIKIDPTLAAAILEFLKADPSLYVRKSVANHLNDIAKDRPEWVTERLATWKSDNPQTGWIIRHALRTLIKQGDPRALALIGVAHGAAVTVKRFSVTPQVELGTKLSIDVDLVSASQQVQRLVVDYRIHYARSVGKTAAKVFKLRTFDLGIGESIGLTIAQTIRDFSTRRHFPGLHKVDLIINGTTMGQSVFELSFEPSR